MTADLPLNAPRPRLCDITKWPDFDGYGFNLHADKTRPGQYIGKVDEDSPADIAGLKEGDRIIEVNGVNISNENHKQVVQRIKAVPNETRLLVVDSEADRWYKCHNLIVRGDQENIIFGSSQKSVSPPSTAVANGSSSISNEDGDSKSVGSTSSSHSENSTQPQHNEVNDHEQPSTQEPPPPIESLTLEDKVAPPPESSCPGDKVDPPPVSSCPGSEDTRDSGSEHDPVLEYDNVRFEHDAETAKINNDNSGSVSPISDVRFEQDAEKAKINNDNSGSVTPMSDAPEKIRRESEDKVSLSSKSSASSSADPKTNDAAPAIAEAEKERSLPDSPHAEDRKSLRSTSPSPPPSINPKTSSSDSPKYNASSNGGSLGLNLNMTAAEMRAQLASKKKFDPRNDSIDLKKKYQIIQNM